MLYNQDIGLMIAYPSPSSYGIKISLSLLTFIVDVSLEMQEYVDVWGI